MHMEQTRENPDESVQEMILWPCKELGTALLFVIFPHKREWVGPRSTARLGQPVRGWKEMKETVAMQKQLKELGTALFSQKNDLDKTMQSPSKPKAKSKKKCSARQPDVE